MVFHGVWHLLQKLNQKKQLSINLCGLVILYTGQTSKHQQYVNVPLDVVISMRDLVTYPHLSPLENCLETSGNQAKSQNSWHNDTSCNMSWHLLTVHASTTYKSWWTQWICMKGSSQGTGAILLRSLFPLKQWL